MSNIKNTVNKKTAEENKLLTVIVCIVAVMVVAVAIVIAITTRSLLQNTQETSAFIPPEFDSQAEIGMPTVPDGMGYLEVYREGMSFNSFVCGEVNVIDGKADIYFTNPEKNTLWMKLRIFDVNGNVIAETGLIKPNEYLKTVTFDTLPENNSKIVMKIMTYEPNTYYSGGAVSLSTVAKVK